MRPFVSESSRASSSERLLIHRGSEPSEVVKYLTPVPCQRSRLFGRLEATRPGLRHSFRAATNGPVLCRATAGA